MAAARRSTWALRALDGLQYGVVLSGVVVLVASVAAYALALVARGPDAIATVRPLLAAKWLLFVLGFFFMALGAFRLRPAAPYKQNARFSLDLSNSRDAEGIAALAGRLPPLSRFDPSPTERLSTGGRLLVGSVVMLAISLLLELGGVRI
ncbi:DUF7555 family protein [Natronomonas sp. EA1]|uniref:DUF7555 family protein n=1 Tax=Natronomonas sp. EA1 TaxID=3421655 RepID=UPI003EB982EB